MDRITFLLCFILISVQIAVSQDSNSVLEKSLNALNNINAASFYYTESVAPSTDTLKSKTYRRFYKEIINPDDRTIGSTFAWFQELDTTKMEFFYNGVAKGYVNWQNKSIAIDSFYNELRTFRPVGPPFFNYTKSIIRFALETKDSISIAITDIGDSFVFRLTIHDQIVEFFGNDLYYTDINVLPYVEDPEHIRSEYTLWIRKKDYLPFRLKRKMPHNVTFGEYSTARTSTHKVNFNPRSYFPSDFTIKSHTTQERVKQHEQEILLGKVAPPFLLKDESGKTLDPFLTNQKVMILYFTGVGCGPCHASLPFLKKLIGQFSPEHLQIIGLESWKTNKEAVRKYATANEFKFPLLPADAKLLHDYRISSVPTFFILNKNKIITKIEIGYTRSVTDNAISSEIIKLISQ